MGGPCIILGSLFASSLMSILSKTENAASSDTASPNADLTSKSEPSSSEGPIFMSNSNYQTLPVVANSSGSSQLGFNHEPTINRARSFDQEFWRRPCRVRSHFCYRTWNNLWFPGRERRRQDNHHPDAVRVDSSDKRPRDGRQ